MGGVEAHIFSSGCCCWSAKEVRRFGGEPSRIPGAVDASESKEALASDRLLSSDWHLTQLGWVSALAARFSSSREERSLRGFAQLKLNHDAITELSSAAEEERATWRRRHLLWECSASFSFG